MASDEPLETGEEQGSAQLICVFCGRAVRDEDTAIEEGWATDFWTDADVENGPGDGEPCRAACEICAAQHLDDLDDDPCLKSGHEKYLK